MKPNYFKRINGDKIPLPVFFPDATRAIIRTVDSKDIESTKTPGILVNTYHLYKDLGKNVLKGHGGVRDFMSWYGGVISDSGGFQVFSLGRNKLPNRHSGLLPAGRHGDPESMRKSSKDGSRLDGRDDSPNFDTQCLRHNLICI